MKNFKLNQMNMRNQLMVMFLILVISSILAITFFVTEYTQNLLREQTVSEHTQMNYQIVTNINNSINGVNKYYQYLISNRVVLESLQNEGFGTDPETYKSVLYFKDLMFSLLSSSKDIEYALYISIGGNVVSSQSGFIYSDFFKTSSFLQRPFIKDMKLNPFKTIWYTNDVVNTNRIYYIRGVKDPGTGRLLGYLCFIIKDSLFRDQISRLSTSHGKVYISNNLGEVFIQSSSKENETLDPTALIITANKISQIVEHNDKLYISNKVNNSWYIITEISKKYLYSQISKINNWIILIVLICIIFVVILSLYISRKYTKDLSVIVDAMKSAAYGNLTTISNTGSNIEFRSLAYTYNLMIQNIDSLTINLKTRIDEKTRAEKALQDLNDTLEVKVSERTADVEKSLKMLKQTQNKLIENEKMASLGILVSGIAHELNNPLNYISTGIEAIEKVLPNIENDILLKELFNNINIGIERATEIISELSEYSRVHKEDSMDLNIHDCIDLALKILFNEYKDNIEIIKNYSELPGIPGNKGKIIQVMMNIIKNSIDALTLHDQNKKQIIITTKIINSNQNKTVKIDFYDNGPLIPEKELVHIFDPFYTTKEPGKGTGLGLSISQNIIKNHNGGITVVNEKNGVCFSISLPFRR